MKFNQNWSDQERQQIARRRKIMMGWLSVSEILFIIALCVLWGVVLHNLAVLGGGI